MATVQDTMNKVYFGDCRDTMRGLIAQGVKVQMCVTSPPYYGLRDYGHTGQIGLEKTPAEYVAAMVEVFALVREMLADDGVLWLNLGDSYCSTAPGTMGDKLNQRGILAGVSDRRSEASRKQRPKIPEGLKPKDLIGIPWRVAFALQADGWYLRQDIIWSKPNPMPESVKDRCTKAHEYLFLLSKSERYYFDAAAIAEPSSAESVARYSRGRSDTHKWADGGPGGQTIARSLEHMKERAGAEEVMRNRRSVWTVPTAPYSGAHFATFPPALIEPCILAGSRTGDLVLDPFMGSGTTAQVAQALGRRWLGCELNDDYSRMQQERTAQSALAI